MNHVDSVSKALEAAKRVGIPVINFHYTKHYYIDTLSKRGARNFTVGFCTKEGKENVVEVCLFDERGEVSAVKAETFEAALKEYIRLCKQEGVTVDLMVGYVLDVYFAALEDRQSFLDFIG